MQVVNVLSVEYICEGLGDAPLPLILTSARPLSLLSRTTEPDGNDNARSSEHKEVKSFLASATGREQPGVHIFQVWNHDSAKL